MSRVEIAGQFPLDFPIFAGRKPYAIDRNPTSVRTDRVPSWNKFCDDADAALAPLSRSKALLWVFACAFTVVFIVSIVLASLEVKLPYGISGFAPFVAAFVLLAGQTTLGCFHLSRVRRAAKEVREACARCSGDGVAYALKEEIMQDMVFNRGILSCLERQYYVTVEVDDEQGLGEPEVAPAPQGEATTALEDMLNEPLIAGKEEVP